MNAELRRNGELCPACGEGHLHSRTGIEQVEYKGRHGEVPLHFSACDYCGSELAGEAESVANKRAMLAFRKTVDGLLTGQEIRDFRARMELSQDLAASLFGGGKVAFSRYENDDIAQSTPMDRLIRVCNREPSILLMLAEEASVTLPSKQLNAIARQTPDVVGITTQKWEIPEDFMRAYARAAEGLHQAHDGAAERCANDDQYMKYGQLGSQSRLKGSAPAWSAEMIA